MARNLKLKAARAALDMTQKDLAEAVGISRQTVNAIERGNITPLLSCAGPFAGHWARRWMNFSGRTG